ncbi:MAG TPA: hypothetical protein VGL77_20340, partial [Armatimonadota bacterium]
GNTYVFGDPILYGRWMREYNALPRLPFTRVEEAIDPVAVWQRTGDDGLYFYAVNREQYPVSINITVKNAPDVTGLGTGDKVALPGSILHLALQPFELRSFRAPRGAKIARVDTLVPADRVAFVKDRLVFAQQVADSVTTGAYQRNLSAEDRQTFLEMLDQAWSAFRLGHYWRTRVLLSMAPMMRVYGQVSGYPENQVITRFPDLLSPYPGAFYILPKPMLNADALSSGMAEGAKPAIVDSTTINPEWGDTKVLLAKNGRLDVDLNVPAEGPYRLAIGYVVRSAGALLVSINGRSLSMPITAKTADAPSSAEFPVVTLPTGTAHLTIQGDLAFGVYGVQLLPMLRAVPSEYWATAGPFTTKLTKTVRGGGGFPAELLKEALLAKFDPDTQSSLTSPLRDSTGEERKWALQAVNYPGTLNARGVDFAVRCKSSVADICYAQTFITTPRACDLLVMMGTDWWANLYLNGQLVKSDLAQTEVDGTGGWFTTKYFRPVVLHLNAGVNRLLCKNQGGSLGNSFMLYAMERAEITFTPMEK